jgi:hypothetical protein
MVLHTRYVIVAHSLFQLNATHAAKSESVRIVAVRAKGKPELKQMLTRCVIRFGTISLICALACCLVCLRSSAGQNGLRSELESILLGKSVVSKIPLGRDAVLGQLAGTNYPVNTLVYPESSEIRYRVEQGFIRGDAEDARVRKYHAGSQFRVDKIDFKGDRLELRLQTPSGDSAKLKIMLRKDWQTKLDAAFVLRVVSRLIDVDQVPQQEYQVATAVQNLAQANAEQTGTALRAELVIDSRGLSAALSTFRKSYGGIGGFLRNPQAKPPTVSQNIAELQKRLGKEITASAPADVTEMAEAVQNCIDYLSSFYLVSYMEPNVAQEIRRSADNTLQKMNEASTKITGANLRSLLAITRAHLLEAALATKHVQIPAEVTTVQAIENSSGSHNPPTQISPTPQTATNGSQENPSLPSTSTTFSDAEANANHALNVREEVPQSETDSPANQAQVQEGGKDEGVKTSTPDSPTPPVAASNVAPLPQTSNNSRPPENSGLRAIAVLVVLSGVIVFVAIKRRSKIRIIEEEEQQREQQLRQHVEDKRISARPEYKEAAERFDVPVEFCKVPPKDSARTELERTIEGLSRDCDKIAHMIAEVGTLTSAAGSTTTRVPDMASVPKQAEQSPRRSRGLGDILLELDGMIGLSNVKQEVHAQLIRERMDKLRQVEGLKVSDMSSHMVFYGKPGTGKTTIARLIGEIYKAMGIISSGHLIEADSWQASRRLYRPNGNQNNGSIQ